MTKEYVDKVTLEEIRGYINQYITEYTAYTVNFDSLEEAVNSAVKDIYQRVNDFEVLTQEMIDDQAENYDGYLEGAEIGDLVWGDNEMWVSQSTIESWDYNNTSSAESKDLDVRDIENLVGDFLILDRLKTYNNEKG